MVDLNSANAHQDSQDFEVGRFEGQRRIQARPALLDERKVESRRVCNRLHAGFLRSHRGDWLGLVRGGVGVVEWNRGLILNCEWAVELYPEIRVLGASVPCIP